MLIAFFKCIPINDNQKVEYICVLMHVYADTLCGRRIFEEQLPENYSLSAIETWQLFFVIPVFSTDLQSFKKEVFVDYWTE